LYRAEAGPCLANSADSQCSSGQQYLLSAPSSFARGSRRREAGEHSPLPPRGEQPAPPATGGEPARSRAPPCRPPLGREHGGRLTLECGIADLSAVSPGLPPSDRWSYFSVRDFGIGIASEELASVFEPYGQLSRGRRLRHGGVGLGLALSRDLARLMGGDLTAESVQGAGSTFTLWLPAAAPLPEQ
jgi:hypothetical protein